MKLFLKAIKCSWVFYVFFHIFFIPSSLAQQQDDIRATALIIRNLRYIQNNSSADDIITEVITRKHAHDYTSQASVRYNFYKKTSMELVANKEFIQQQVDSNKDREDSFYRKYIHPFESWMDYAREIPNTEDLSLTTLLREDYGTAYENPLKNRRKTDIHASRNVSLFDMLGQKNISHFLDEVFGDIDLYQNENQLMLMELKTPLADDAHKIYSYRLLGFKNINGIDCYEILFYAKNIKENAFAGYLYIDISSYTLQKAVFTLNHPENMHFLKNALITHTYSKSGDVMCPIMKENAIVLGDELNVSASIMRTICYSDYVFTSFDMKDWKSTTNKNFHNQDSLYWQSVRLTPLTPAQKQIDALMGTAVENKIYVRFQELLMILLTDYVTIGGIDGKVEIGPLLRLISYNNMEGFRLRIGGNTTVPMMERLHVGGYVAYGINDKRWKYRTNLIYSFHPRDKYIWEYPKRSLSFTYVNDLNIPGQDLLTTQRDNVIYSFSSSATTNMSHQKIGLLTFETENKNHFSYKIDAKYMSEKIPDTKVFDRINTTELALSLRYAPHESFYQNRTSRIPIRRGDIELSLNHRVGIKGILGSDYNYHITSADAYKKINLNNSVGTLFLMSSAGMIWNKVPYPLLFIPIGNQSYIYQVENYNCMNFYEFTTDRFISGNINFFFNWSPLKWLDKNNKIRTSIGAKAIYGPLSNKNNPQFHSDLYPFNEGITPLGKTPYVEVNVGLVNILKILRVEYSHRLTYIDKPTWGSLMVTGNFAF